MYIRYRKLKRTMLRWAAMPIGAVIFLAGAVTFPLPLPTGIILMVAGIAVAAFNPLMLRWLKRTRKRFPRFNARIRRMTPFMPAYIARILMRSDSPAKQRRDAGNTSPNNQTLSS